MGFKAFRVLEPMSCAPASVGPRANEIWGYIDDFKILRVGLRRVFTVSGR